MYIIIKQYITVYNVLRSEELNVSVRAQQQDSGT